MMYSDDWINCYAHRRSFSAGVKKGEENGRNECKSN